MLSNDIKIIDKLIKEMYQNEQYIILIQKQLYYAKQIENEQFQKELKKLEHNFFEITFSPLKNLIFSETTTCVNDIDFMLKCYNNGKLIFGIDYEYYLIDYINNLIFVNTNIDALQLLELEDITEILDNITQNVLLKIIKFTVANKINSVKIQHYFQDAIEKILIPKINNNNLVTHSSGTFIYFYNWLEKTSLMLINNNINYIKFDNLYSNTKLHLPDFIENVENVLRNGIANILILDDNYQSQLLLETNKKKIISNMPNDIFTLFNQQIEILNGFIKDENYIECYRALIEVVNDTFVSISSKLSHKSDDYQKICLYINNYTETLRYILEIKHVIKINSTYLPRITNITFKLINTINDGINNFIIKLSELSLTEIKDEVILKLFTIDWISNDLLKIIFDTINDYVGCYKQLINFINLNKVVDGCLRLVVEMYIEQFIFVIKSITKFNIKYEAKHLVLLHSKPSNIKRINKNKLNFELLLNSLIRDDKTVLDVISNKLYNTNNTYIEHMHIIIQKLKDIVVVNDFQSVSDKITELLKYYNLII